MLLLLPSTASAILPQMQKANASFLSKLKLPLEKFFPGGKKKIEDTQGKLSGETIDLQLCGFRILNQAQRSQQS